MTADMTAIPTLANNPVVRSLDSIARGSDAVRARVRVQPIVTNAERLQAEEAARSATQPRKTRAPLGIEMLADTRLGRYVENLHPSDIFYWVACVGGACLLLIKATI